MSINLSSADANQVASFQTLEVELVDPSRKMFIFSGIAIPSFNSSEGSSNDTIDCHVDLGIALPGAQQAVAQVGLASIINDDSQFLFAVDNAIVEIQKTTGRVSLRADLAVNGDGTALNRFGFQVVVVSDVRATGVTGRVIWNKSLFDATSLNVNVLAGLFKIKANLIEAIDAPGNQFKATKLVSIGSADPQSLHIDGDDFWTPYAFSNLPLDTPLVITVENLATVYAPGASAGQIHGPYVVNLHPGHLLEAGVDFRITVNTIR